MIEKPPDCYGSYSAKSGTLCENCRAKKECEVHTTRVDAGLEGKVLELREMFSIMIEEGVNPKRLADTYIERYGVSPDLQLSVVKEAKEFLKGKEEESEEEEGEFFDETNKFIPKWLADHIQKEYIFKTPRDTGDIWVYNDGIYERSGQAMINEVASRMLEDKRKQHYVKETIECVRAATFVDRRDFNKDKNYICLKNGLFNLETLELEDFNPDVILTGKMPVNYDPNAKCPKIVEFIKDVCYDADVATIQEFVGFCLSPDYFIRAIIVLHGIGGNGKTTFINLLERFLGVENISAVSLQEFAFDRFARADLFGKMANLCDDMPNEKISTTGNIKQLTGGSLVGAQFKFKPRFTFTNRAKALFAANELPEITDKTDAMWERMRIITFPFQFVDEPNGPQQKKKKERIGLLDELCTDEELSGLFNWGIGGLKRLRGRGDFSYARTVDERREEYMRKSKPVSAFAQDHIVLDQESEVDKKVCFSKYASYCKREGYAILGYQTFCVAMLEEFGDSIVEVRPRVGDQRKRVWRGIRIVEVKDDENENFTKNGQKRL